LELYCITEGFPKPAGRIQRRCTRFFMLSLAGEIARNPGASRPFTEYIKDSLSAISEKLAPEDGRKDEARAEAVRILVGLVGAVVLARAIDDKALSDEILVRTHADLVRCLGPGRGSDRKSPAKRRSGKSRSLAASKN
jgi:hypothetical protein